MKKIENHKNNKSDVYVESETMRNDTVRCAMWNAATKRFEMPFVAADFAHPQFEGYINTLFYNFEGSTSQLVHGHVYDLLVQARKYGEVLRGNVLKVLDEQTPSYTLSQLLSNDRIPDFPGGLPRCGHGRARRL